MEKYRKSFLTRRNLVASSAPAVPVASSLFKLSKMSTFNLEFKEEDRTRLIAILNENAISFAVGSAAENTMETDTSVDFDKQPGAKQSTSDDEADMNVNELAKNLKSWLLKNRISQGSFAERYLKRGKGTMSDYLSKPSMPNTTQGREVWSKIKNFLEDEMEQEDLRKAVAGSSGKNHLFKKEYKCINKRRLLLGSLDHLEGFFYK